MLKYFVFALLLASAHSVCSTARIRKEWRQMSSTEKTTYLTCLNLMKADGSSNGYDQFAHIHGQMGIGHHGTAHFLPWHRIFLFKFEERLRQGPGCDCATVPYWDWTMDDPNPAASPLFAHSAFGPKLGAPAPDYCTTAGVTFDAPAWTNSHAGMPTCVARRASAGGFWDATSMVNLLNPAQFSIFWPSVEGSPHGSVHMFVGGSSSGHMGNIRWSPDDPLFWAHHAFIDLVWAAWQACHGYDQIAPSSLTNVHYSGSGSYAKHLGMNFGALAPWTGIEVWTVEDAWTTQGLGYSYSFGTFSTNSLIPSVCTSDLNDGGSFDYIRPSYAADSCQACLDESPLFGWCKTSYGGGYCHNPQTGPYSCTAVSWYRPYNSLRRDCDGNYHPFPLFPWFRRLLVLEREVELFHELNTAGMIPLTQAHEASVYTCKLLKRELQDYYVPINDRAISVLSDPNNPDAAALQEASPIFDFGRSQTPLTDPTLYGRMTLQQWFDQMESEDMRRRYAALIGSGDYDPICGFPDYFRITDDPRCIPAVEMARTGVTLIGETARVSYGRMQPDCLAANQRPTATIAGPLRQSADNQHLSDLSAVAIPQVQVHIDYDTEIPNSAYYRWGEEYYKAGLPQFEIDIGIHTIKIGIHEDAILTDQDYIYIEGLTPTICPGKEPRAYIADVKIASSIPGINRRNVRVMENGLRIFLGVQGKPVTPWCRDGSIYLYLEYKY